MDKSPLKTLTLEDFLESERHKLTGELTPVTPETFAKWKANRLSKKAAEEEARKAKDATGRAMFEAGGWEESSAEEESDDDDEGDDDDDDNDDDAWNMENLRKETERAKEDAERERIRKLGGQVDLQGVNGHAGEDGAVGVNEVVENRVGGDG